MLEFEIEFSKLQKKIHDMSSSGDEDMEHLKDLLENEDELSIRDLFHREFMGRHTDFNTIDAFFEHSGWGMKNRDGFAEIPEENLDAYVDKHSKFGSWNAMKIQALTEYLQTR